MNNHQNGRFVLELSMTIDAADLAAFLTNIHLFHYLSEEQVAIVAAGLKELHLAADVEVIKEGTEGNSLYLIYSGSVRVTRKGEKAAARHTGAARLLRRGGPAETPETHGNRHHAGTHGGVDPVGGTVQKL